MVLRQVERRLRSQGHSKSWATRYATKLTTAELLRLLPLTARLRVRFRHACGLIGDAIRSSIGVRSGE